MDNAPMFVLGGVILAVIGLLVWVVIADSREMDRKKTAFYSSCLAHRQPYDCDMQWDTFKSARDAEMMAAGAMGMAAGSAAARSGK